MAEDFIEEIYGYSNLITQLKDFSKYSMQCKSGYYFNNINEYYAKLCNLSTIFIKRKYSWAEEFADALLLVSEHGGDIKYICDIGMMYLVPILEKWIKEIGSIKVEVDSRYTIESSVTGYLTLYSNKNMRYFHSIYDPMQEAQVYVERIYDPSFSEYVVFGCGMGYQIYQLYLKSQGSIHITVYEQNSDIIQWALNYGVLGWIPEDNIEIIVDDDIMKFLEKADGENTGIMILPKAVHEMDDESDREIINSIYVQYNSLHNQKDLSTINFYRNIEMNLPDVNMLECPLKEDVVIVAGGPTLDDGIELLRKWKGEKSIIAVMTVFRKLVEKGIKPDYVMALDPSEEMEKHLLGVEDEDVPAILDINVFWKWTRFYHGPKYMCYSSSVCPVIDDYIKRNNKIKWGSGGTVTYQALEFALANDVKNIYLMGADMGYPGGESHSTGTAQYEVKSADGLHDVPGVYGSVVKTDAIMNEYRSSIEERIAEISSEIKIYNLSTAGASIKGTIEVGRMYTPDYAARNLFRNIRSCVRENRLSYEQLIEEISLQDKALTDNDREALIELITDYCGNNIQDKVKYISLCYDATKNQLYSDIIDSIGI